jgi:predicted RecA/RadA family phage recombinase
MIARPRIRSLLTTVLTWGALSCSLVLLGTACEKGGSNPPDGGGSGDGGGTTKPAEDGGKDYVYPAEGFKLMATTTIKMEIASTQGQGTAELSARSLIEAKPSGDNLEIHGKVVELIGYTGTGQLDPEFLKKQAEEAGEKPMDLLAELAKSEGWSIVDRKGKADAVATKALPQNQGETGAAVDFGLFGLPDLPRVDLEVGKKVELPTKADERQLPFGSIPVEIDMSWTLRSVNGNVAELDVSSEGSGATEFDGGQGTATVSMLEESSYTIMFDLTTKLPISVEGYSASEINVDASGQEIKFASNNEVKTSYEVAP